MTTANPPLWGPMPKPSDLWELVKMDKEIAKVTIYCTTALAAIVVIVLGYLVATGKDIVVLGSVLMTVLPILLGQLLKHRNGKTKPPESGGQ